MRSMDSHGTASWYVYMLSCEDGSLYTGITTDVSRRIREHLGLERGGARYTRAHRPVGLAAAWKTLSRSAASRIELAIKGLDRADKLALVANPATIGTLVGSETFAEALDSAALTELWPI